MLSFSLRSIVFSGFFVLGFNPVALACSSVAPDVYILPDTLIDTALSAHLVRFDGFADGEEEERRPARSISEKPVKLSDILEAVRRDSQNLQSDPEIYGLARFSVLETLTGAPQAEFEINVRLNHGKSLGSTYENHTSHTFWISPSLGRASIGPDCSVRTSFHEGQMYLIVLAERQSVKSFERIETLDDQWLQFARERLASPNN